MGGLYGLFLTAVINLPIGFLHSLVNLYVGRNLQIGYIFGIEHFVFSYTVFPLFAVCSSLICYCTREFGL